MPLLGKKPFLSVSQIKTDSSEQVYVIPHTKERFSSESEFEKRKDLYEQSIWTCRATGHINMTHEEALKSEQAMDGLLKEQFSQCFEKAVLEFVHHSTRSLEAMIDESWLLVHQQLVVGEKVNLKVKVADKLIPAKVTSVDKSTTETKDGSSCNSPSSDKENSKDNSKKWTPPKLLPYLYSIELEQEAKVIHSVPGEDLVRLERVPSKDMLRLFIRVSALRSGNYGTSPWVVNEDLVKKYKLVNKFNDFFLSPAKMAEASKRAEENKKKRKLSNGQTSSASKKLKLDSKGKNSNNGKELKVLQFNKTTKKKSKDKDGAASPKKSPRKSPTKSCVVVSDSDDDVTLSTLKKSKAKDSDSDSDVPLYQLVDHTTPKKSSSKSKKRAAESSDEDIPLSKINTTPKKSTPKKKQKTPSKKPASGKSAKQKVKKKETKKTGMKQATLFDLTKKGKSVIQKTPVKKSPSKTANSTPVKKTPPIPLVVRKLQSAKRDSFNDKLKYANLLKHAANVLTPAQMKRVPDKLKEEIEHKKRSLEEKALLSKMSEEEKEEYMKKKKLAAKEKQKEKLLQKLRDQRKRFEDTDLDLTPLPTPKMVPSPEGFPNNLFGEVAMVTEFINCFGGLLMPDSEYPIFTDPLMKALVGGPNGFTYLSRVLTVLLQTLLQDEIAKGYKELNTPLSDIPVTPYTASELMRLCLECEEDSDDEDDEASKNIQLLGDSEFYRLELEQKLNLMRGLCSRVLETYSAQDYMEEQQKQANQLMKQRTSDMKQISAQKKSEKQDSSSPSVSKPTNGTDEAGTNKDSPSTANGCASIASFYGKEAQDSGEDSEGLGGVVKRRRVLAAKAAEEKERRERERAIQKEKEYQLEKKAEETRRKQAQLVDAINLARMVLRQESIGTDRHHDRYWVFTNTTPGLYIEKGWMGEEVKYTVKKSHPLLSDEDMSSDSDSDVDTDALAANIAANQTGMTPMKVKYLTKRHFIEKSAPHPGQNIWLTYRSVKDLDALLKSLHSQGIRESLLKAEVKKRYDDIVKAITMSQRANLELRSSDGDVEMLSSFQKELCDMELRLRNGGLGGVPNFDKWEKRLNETKDTSVLGECMLEVQAHVTEKFVQGFMKPAVKTEEPGEDKVKDEAEDDDDEEEEVVEEEESPKRKEDKNEKAFRLWKESLASCQTMSRLHVLLCMLDSCIKWEKSAENAKCKICRKKCDDDCLLLCDECNQAFHLYCLRPALSKVPNTDWFCPSCKPRRSPAKNVEYDSEEEEEKKDTTCRECGGDDQLMVCSKCPSAYHPECHNPPLRRAPRGVWDCSDCKSGKNRKRNNRLSRRANQKRSYRNVESEDEEEEEEDEEEEEESESEEEEEITPKRRGRQTKSSTSTGGSKQKAARSRERKASSRNTSYSESLTPTLRTSKRGPSELSLCEQVLNRVVKHKSSWPFLEPVDRKEVPDYHLLIKKPMDFQTMQKNCARLNYSSPQEFIEDAALVFENAESYNKPNTEVFECMKEVEKLFKEQLKKLLPDWPYYRTVVEHDCSSGSETGKRRSRNK